MATKADCIAAAMKGGLTRQEAGLAVDALFEDKAKVQTARAGGKIVNAERATAEAWAVRMDDARAAGLKIPPFCCAACGASCGEEKGLSASFPENPLSFFLARPRGIEPLTKSLEGSCSVHLSYGRSQRN